MQDREAGLEAIGCRCLKGLCVRPSLTPCVCLFSGGEFHFGSGWVIDDCNDSDLSVPSIHKFAYRMLKHCSVDFVSHASSASTWKD